MKEIHERQGDARTDLRKPSEANIFLWWRSNLTPVQQLYANIDGKHSEVHENIDGKHSIGSQRQQDEIAAVTVLENIEGTHSIGSQ